ncbi:MAG: preprotein translocase subunit YajC [Bacteroidetes bacterium]|nr:MAG: preprotein translocase subunit YajC [Bacteroidota bacterium]
MNLMMILLQEGTSSGSGGGFAAGGQFIFLIGILAVFYFFMIRPQQKRAKADRIFRENLKKGDKVMTIGGIYGKVVSIDDQSVLLQVDDNVKIRIDKTALKPAANTENK